MSEDNPEAVKLGLKNLEKHLETVASFDLPAVVALNHFIYDSEAEIEVVRQACKDKGVPFAVSKGFAEGGKGTADLAQVVVEEASKCKNKFSPTYDLQNTVTEKIEKICKTIYGAKGVVLSTKAKLQLKKIERLGFGNFPVCMAKTQKSLSDNDKLLGRPENFDINIREFEIAAGAGFIIPIAGNMLRMPGLPELPASEHIDIDDDGVISGLS